MRVLVVLLCVLVAAALVESINRFDPVAREFQSFKKTYKKVYSDAEEEETRLAIFRKNFANLYKLRMQNPHATFGITKFSDLSPEEFSKYYLMPNSVFQDYVAPPVKTDFTVAKNFAPDPTTWNWFTKGVCTPVYNQGQCGSCWAFSATETIESYFVVGGGKLTGLSMEQIVDCDTSDHGCNGGMPSSAYSYVQSAGGIDSYSSYPYTAGGGTAGQCQFNAGNVVTNVASQNAISGETGLYTQASSAGPVSVCVDASSWQTYKGGVLKTCGNNVDHCVQLTGYTDHGKSTAYWVVRNSWGSDWGETGFIYILIGKDLCSIGDYATVVKTS